MKNFFALFAAVALVSFASLAQAGTVRLAGDVGQQPAGKTTGIIQVLIDLEAGQTMSNGGVVLGVTNSNPGGSVAFTDAEVLNPAGRWTIATDATSSALADFNTSSFATPGLPAGGQGVLFATINWQKTGSGRSDLAFTINAEAFVDGANGDVTNQYTGQSNFVSFASDVPEPSSLGLAGLSLIGLVLRRRNG